MGKRLLIIICILIVGCWYSLSPVNYDSFDTPLFEIRKGDGASLIASRLKERGFIRSELVFKVMYKLKSTQSFKVGSYPLTFPATSRDILDQLKSHNAVKQYTKLIIPEGYSILDVSREVERLGLFDQKEFFDYCHNQAKYDFQNRFTFLKDIPVNTIEGYLFPDTYFVDSHNTIKDVVQMMLTQFETQIAPLWAADPSALGSPKQRFNFHKVLTIGSLIEKEVRRRPESRRISGVFYNRLKKKMALASDPTVLYSLGMSHKDRVYYKDTRVDSPYNTYKYSGFPPSPISSVGVSSFKASLDPEAHDFYFFVANSNGTHIFTKNYAEHLSVQRRKK